MPTLAWIAILIGTALVFGIAGLWIGYSWGRRSAYEEIDEKQMYATIED